MGQFNKRLAATMTGKNDEKMDLDIYSVSSGTRLYKWIYISQVEAFWRGGEGLDNSCKRYQPQLVTATLSTPCHLSVYHTATFSEPRANKEHWSEIQLKLWTICWDYYGNWNWTTQLKEELCKSSRDSTVLLTLHLAMCICFYQSEKSNLWSGA